MHPDAVLPGWDTAIMIAPLFVLLGIWMFGLDERVAAPRARTARRRFCQPDLHGEQAGFSDPDGQVWRSGRPIRDAAQARTSGWWNPLSPDGASTRAAADPPSNHLVEAARLISTDSQL